MIAGRLTRILLVLPLLAAGISLGSPQPASAATPCGAPAPAGQSITGGTVRDSIVVPANTVCYLQDAVVRGGVTVEPGASLVSSNTEIRGDVNGTNITAMRIVGGSVRGGVTVVGTYYGVVQDAEVRGNVTLSSAVYYVGLYTTEVRGSATLTNSPTVNVENNVIEVNLTCTAGDSGSTYGPNTVEGATNCPAP